MVVFYVKKKSNKKGIQYFFVDRLSTKPDISD